MSRSDAYIRVECDRCGKESVEVALTSLAAHDWDLAGLLQKNGWTAGIPGHRVSRLQDDLCPNCTALEIRSKELRRV